jgi:hypothetical protein
MMGRKAIELNRICEHCSRPFTAYSRQAKYCSNGCRVSAYKLRHGIPSPDFKQFKRIPSTAELKLIEKINENKDLANKLDIVQKKILSYQAETDKKYNYMMLIKETTEDDRMFYKHSNNRLLRDNKIPFSTPYSEIKKIIKQLLVDAAKEEFNNAQSMLDEYKRKKEDIEYEIDENTRSIKSLQKNYAIEEHKASNKVITVGELYEKEFDLYHFQHPYSHIFGQPEKCFLAMMYGEKGSGKSTFALEFADYFQRQGFGNVLYLSLEEGASYTFVMKAQRNDLTPDITISETNRPEEIKKMAQAYQLIIIDSVNTANLTKEDIELITSYRRMYNISFLLLYQATKAGDYKGDSGIAHESDIVLEAKYGTIFCEKNRYGNFRDNEYQIRAFINK